MTVRPAGPGDVEAVRGVRLQALADSPLDFDTPLEEAAGWTPEEWRAWISRRATFLLDGPNGPGGIVALDPHRSDADAMFLGALWVAPELRGTGAADALVTAALARAESGGATTVWLHVVKTNGRARRFYERNGFHATGEEILREPDGVPEVEMRFELGQNGIPGRRKAT